MSDEEGKIKLCRHYEYDDWGNVTTERVYGFFTGNEASPIIIHKGKPSGGECYQKTFKYEHPFNVVTEEIDGSVKYEYQYFKIKEDQNTDLLKAKYTIYDGKIRIREFFSYDANAAITHHIIDTGSAKRRDSWQGVTERRKAVIKNYQKYPEIGLPKEIAEYYFDEKQQQVLLKKTRYFYDTWGRLEKQEVKDALDQVQYILKRRYDNFGNIESEKYEYGDKIIETKCQYDKNGNKIYEQGPRQDYHKEYKYDLSNRLKTEEWHVNCDTSYATKGTIFTKKYEYDDCGNRKEE